MLKEIIRSKFTFIKKNNIKLLYRPIINRFYNRPFLFMITPYYQYFNFDGSFAKLNKQKNYVVVVYRGDANLAVVRSTVEALKKHYIVIVVCLSDIDTLFNEFNDPNVYVISSHLFNGLEKDLINLYKNAKIVFCIHAATSVVVDYCARNRIKCIWWLHEPAQYLNNKYIFPSIPEINHWISLWAVSKVSKEAILKIYPNAEIKIIHNGFNFPIFDEQKKQEKTTILISGGDWIKGMDVLLDALLTFNKTDLRHIKLVAIDNNHSDYYYRNIKRFLEVEVVQWLPEINFFEKINTSDLIIIPSYCETLSFVAIQCMAYKKPFICSDTAGIVEYIPKELKSKLVFKNKKSKELANLIRYYLDNKNEYKKIVDKLHNIYKNEFSLSVFNSRFYKLLNEELKTDSSVSHKHQLLSFQRCLISIIIPVYNVEKYLRRCLDSVVNQSYVNIEIILIDDGSTDQSGAICDEYAKKDNRILVIHKENGGLSSARNCGLDRCKGKYVAFVDSDDYVKADFIKLLYENAKKYKCDISACSVEQCMPSGYVYPLFVFQDQKLSDYLDFCGYCCWNKLYKKNIFKTLRFPLGKLSEDLFIYFQIMYYGKNICTTSDLLYCYSNMREDSICNRLPKAQLFDSFEACQCTTDFMISNNVDKKHFIIWRKIAHRNYIDGMKALKERKLKSYIPELDSKYEKLLKTIDFHIDSLKK